MGLRRTHVNTETGEARADFRVHSHQERSLLEHDPVASLHGQDRDTVHVQYLKRVVSAAAMRARPFIYSTPTDAKNPSAMFDLTSH